MQNAQLQAMTVVQLRKLAKENGVKLSAGIDKSGIVARLSEVLADEPSNQSAAPQPVEALVEPAAPELTETAREAVPVLEPDPIKTDEKPAETQEKAAGGGSFRGCNRCLAWRLGISALEQPAGTERLPPGLSTGLAGTQHVAR